MPTQSCPKCRSVCQVSERNVELGVSIECACGCKFDVFPRRLEFGGPEVSPKSSFTFAGVTMNDGDSAPRVRAPGGVPYSLMLLVGGLAVVGFVWSSLWMVALFLISASLAAFCRKRRAAWKAHDDKSPWYFFFDKSVDFLVPLAGVTLFYSLLSLLVAGTSDRTTLGRLETLEGLFDSLKYYLSYVVFKPWIAALIIGALIVFDLLVTFYLKPSALASRYKDYNKWSKRVYMVVVLLCSFTFFGNQIGEQKARLRLRTDKIKTGYRKLREEAEDALHASVQQQLYEKVRVSLPPEVAEAFDYTKDEASAVSSLRQNYTEVKKYGVKDPRADEILARYDRLAKQTSEYTDQPVRYDEPRGIDGSGQKADVTSAEVNAADEAAARPASLKLSGETVEAALSELKAKRPLRARLVELLKTDGVKQLLCQFPKSFTSVAKSTIYKNVVGEYPLLEQVVDVFVGTYDKHIEGEVKASADRVADALLENPERVDEVLSAEAKKISDSVEVKPPRTILEKLKSVAAEMKNDLKGIRAATQKVSSSLAYQREQEAAKTRADEARAEEARQRQAEERYERTSPMENPFGKGTSRDDSSDVGPCYCVDLQTGARTYVGIRTRAQCTGMC
jgi:hypothetical protein